MTRRAATSERGIALLLVLWTLTLLSMLVVPFAQQTRLERHRVANLIDAAKAGAAVQAGLALAIRSLLDPANKAGWIHDGTSYEVPYGVLQMRIAIQDGNGLVNINAADAAQLEKLLQAAGVQMESRRGLAAAIVDWRDGDSLRSTDGAETAEYAAADAATRPANRPFLSVEELASVLGMTPPVVDRLLPLATVYATSSEPSPMTAPAPLLAAFVPKEQIAGILERRAARAKRSAAGSGPSQDYSLQTDLKDAASADLAELAEGPVYALRIEATTDQGGVAAGRAIVWLTQDAERPYRVLDWRPIPQAEPRQGAGS